MGPYPMRRLPGLLLVALFSVLPLTAAAQSQKGTTKDARTPAPAAASVPAAPQRTTASFGDWVLRCESIAAQSKRVCEVAHMIVAQGQTAPLAQIAIGRQAPNEAERLTVVVPPNIAIGVKLQVITAKAGAAPIELTWQRCMPGGCFASVALSNAALNELTAPSEPGRIVFANAANHEIALPLSLRGLSQAMTALAKEP